MLLLRQMAEAAKRVRGNISKAFIRLGWQKVLYEGFGLACFE
jgi:hypothetical protein